MYLLIVFLPFISSGLAVTFGRFLGFWGTAIITTLSLIQAFIIALNSIYRVVLKGFILNIKVNSWMSSEVFHVDWGFLFDSLSILMCVIVTFISLLVHIYSIEYMSHDPHLPRFLSYLSLFTFFMLVLVTADNYIQLFVGWEGVGLASYLLINFWYTRIQANKAAIKAMVINRVGDFFLLIGILLIFTNFKSVDYCSLYALTPFFNTMKVTFLGFNCSLYATIGIFIFLGAVGKSAQIGLHTWLPDAMEGPTPVSALIHAATMVTAGVFLLARSSFIYEQSPKTLDLIALVGSVTAIFASSIGLAQNDIKKVIAYSTCSQLGYMIFACGLSNYYSGFFHLLNHAFFKALLFLSAGSIIHSVNDEQDMRKLGGLSNLLPFTYSAVLVGSLALIGFPFLSGFYSKDLILEAAAGSYLVKGYFCYLLGSIGAFFTSFYSMRLFFLTFLSKPNGHKKSILNALDSGQYITVSLTLLIIPSLSIGYLLKDITVGLGTPIYVTSVFIYVNNFNLYDAEFINIYVKLTPVIISLIGFIIAFFCYLSKSKILFSLKTSETGKIVYNFLNRKWFFDKLYSEYLSQSFFKLGFSLSYKFADRGVFEMLGASGLSYSVTSLSTVVHSLQKGHIYHNSLLILAGSSYLLILRYTWVLAGYFEWYTLFLPILVYFIISHLWNNPETSKLNQR